MPDFQNFSITTGTSANVNTFRFTISCQIVDSKTGLLITDFTGANAILFPAVMNLLTAAQRMSIMQEIAPTIIRLRAGIG